MTLPKEAPREEEFITRFLATKTELSEEEKTVIADVIRRDAEMKRAHASKLSALRRDIQRIRRASVIRAGDDLDRMCVRCHTTFGNHQTKVRCVACQHFICFECRVKAEEAMTEQAICLLCNQQKRFDEYSGGWIFKLAKKKKEMQEQGDGKGSN